MKFNIIKTIIFFFFLVLNNHSLNAQDSLDVKWLGSCLGSTARKAAYGEIDSDSYLFVFQHGSILVLDVNDPTNPQKVVEIGNPGEPGQTWIGGLAVADTFLYITIEPYGLWVYNIADPYAPMRIGTCKTGHACGVAVSGDYAYVADSDSGLVIIDISQPSTPIKVSSLYLEGSATDVAISDTFAYVADGKLRIVNIANPLVPSLIGTWNPHGFNEDVIQVAVQGNFVYLANFWLGFWIVDVTNPQSPVSADSILYGLALDIAVNGNYAYGAAEDWGIVIINISNPHNVYTEGTLNTPGSAQGIDCFGNNVYVADYDSTLIINIIDPTDPILVGAYDNLNDFASDVAISGDYAYVSYRYEGLRIVDISNPYFPNEVGYWDTPGMARGVAVSDSFAYVADYDSGLRIININNPYSPYEVGYYDTIGFTNNVVIDSIYAYVADGQMGLQIIDISDPTSPFLISSLPPVPFLRAYSVCKSGDYIYLGYDWAVLEIINVSEPYLPYKIGRFTTWSNILDVTVSASYVHLASSAAFYIIDVADVSSPIALGFLQETGSGVTLFENYTFVGTYAPLLSPLYVVDIADPFNPNIVGYYNWEHGGGPGPSYRVDNFGYNICVAASSYGLQIFRFTGAPGIEEAEVLKYPNTTIAKLEVYPNPFRDNTEIKYEITDDKLQMSDKSIQITIYDATGRLIRQWDYLTIRLSDQVTWDGTDDYGKQVASGVYFCRLNVEEFSKTQKILLLR